MADGMKRLLDEALASPEFMAQVRAAVLESPIVQTKDAEIAALRASLAAAEGALAKSKASHIACSDGHSEIEASLRADLNAAEARAARVRRALDGEREVIVALNRRAEAAEAEVIALRESCRIAAEAHRKEGDRAIAAKAQRDALAEALRGLIERDSYALVDEDGDCRWCIGKVLLGEVHEPDCVLGLARAALAEVRHGG
jgi:hypothetical protein